MTPAISYREPLHPLHAMLLAFPLVLFIAAVATDITYLRTAQIQWSNFSAWLIAGGLFFGSFVVVWALISTLPRPGRWRGGRLVYLGSLILMWIFGFLNALLHSRDAWYSVTAAGIILSLITAILAAVAAWAGYRGFPRKETL